VIANAPIDVTRTAIRLIRTPAFMSRDPARTPLLDRLYQRFLATERSAEFISNVSRHYTLACLERLADGGKRVTRRGAVLAIGFLGDIRHSDVMARKLDDSDRAVRLLADHGIRQLWMRVGNPGIEAGLRRLARLNQRQQFAESVDVASDLLRLAPETAEAWNLRAIAWYSLEDYEEALADCRRAVELNPSHFLAALGAANCHLELGDVVEALQEFRVALKINPDLDMVRAQVDQLQRIVEG
jgi:tetratricopeptide (TPR) repeat protein